MGWIRCRERNYRCWYRCIHGPGVRRGGRIGIPNNINCAHPEGMAAVGQAGVVPGAGASAVAAAQVALETCNPNAAAIVTREGEGGTGAVGRVWAGYSEWSYQVRLRPQSR